MCNMVKYLTSAWKLGSWTNQSFGQLALGKSDIYKLGTKTAIKTWPQVETETKFNVIRVNFIAFDIIKYDRL